MKRFSTQHRSLAPMWQRLSPEEKAAQLKQELREEMLTMAHRMGIHLSTPQILRAIERTRYSPGEMEARHHAHLAWQRQRQHPRRHYHG